MYAILLQKGGGKQDGQQSGTNQQAGQRDDEPKLPVTLFQLRELLADASEKALGSTWHFCVSRHVCSCYQPSVIGTMGYAVHYESKQIGLLSTAQLESSFGIESPAGRGSREPRERRSSSSASF